MKAVISVIGKDTVGILADVAGVCKEENVNVIDVTQTVLDDMFVMTMMVDITDIKCSLSEFSDKMKALGENKSLAIHVMHEDIFNSMHRI